MTQTAAPICTAIAENLTSLPELRPFPAVAARVVAACQDPETSSKDLVQILRCDPAIAARLLSVANSSMYGCSGRIRTIEHAVVVLGFRSVAHLALSVAGATIFSQGETASRERAALWSHSLGVATVGWLLAEHVAGLLPDEAFLAGVFHDVGKLFYYDLAHPLYTELVGRVRPPSGLSPAGLIGEEQLVFGITHPEVGQECGEAWGLTDEISIAIGYHHTPEESPDYFELAAVTGAADVLAWAWQVGGSTEATDAGKRPRPSSGNSASTNRLWRK
ncbi:MAG: HDOD domain-containing protein [Planctomycetes bacterium]|nr:HDOD domain-containing protein [Planctomycetota bacterium]